MRSLRHHLMRGAIAGAAGTTALNMATYLDMVMRGRPGSSAPRDSVERMTATARIHIPGDEENRQARVSGLGALLGAAVGVGAGMMLGAAQAAGWSRSWRATVLPAWALATVAGNAPTIGLRVTDPRRWTATDWLADLVPHAAYAVVTAITLDTLGARPNRYRRTHIARGVTCSR